MLRIPLAQLAVVVAWLVLAGCGNPVGAEASALAAGNAPEAQPAKAEGAPAPTQAPFAVSGEAEGLLLVWFDDKGSHTASTRSEIPEAHRAQVRVESMAAVPDSQLDADHVYLADMRAPKADGSYVIYSASRDWFDAQVVKAAPPPSAADDAAVVIYKASWCGVCRSAAKFLTARHVAFVEKDVEKDPGAQAEMLRKTQAKGLSPHGVPVIDFHGEIMLGFDQERLTSLIDQLASPAKPI